MKIYKNKTIGEFSPSDLQVGETVIIKSSIMQPGFDIITIEESPKEVDVDGCDTYVAELIGSFRVLKKATAYLQFKESGEHQYEYYVQNAPIEFRDEAGTGKNPHLDSMGKLGWELCEIYRGQEYWRRRLV